MKENKTAGVYKITNIITGDFYIGSSKDIKRRWTSHKCLSMWKRYSNLRLYKDMAKYGLDNFIFEVLEETDSLKEREQYWIEQLKPSYNNNWAQGLDIERHKKTSKRYHKEWYKVNRDKKLAKNKVYYSRLCFYEGKTLTLKTLSIRFCRQGIPHPTLKAKEYLIDGKRLMTEKH